jgi:hypothetical protein
LLELAFQVIQSLTSILPYKLIREVYEMRGPVTTKPTVKLIGQDGNAFSIMERVKKALMRPESGANVVSL